MAWAGAALSVPFVFHSFAIFPDGPASVLVLVGVRALAIAAAEEHPRSRDWVLAGAALACLPWMHTRYAILAGVLGVAICLTLVRRTPRGLRACALFLALPFVSAAGWFWYFWSIYGTPSPSAPYGGYTQSAIANLLPGVTGLLVDSQFGLLATAPVLAWSLVGLAKGAFGRGVEAARRAGRLTSFALAALCLVYIAAAGSYRMWWGGASAPARFVVPLVLPLGVALAIAWTTARSYAARALMVGAVTVGLWLTIVLLLVDGGRLAYNDRDGLALWAAWASPAVDLARALPGVHRGPVAIALAQAGAWLSAGVLAWLALRAYERRGAPDPARLASAAVLVMGMAAVAGAAVSWTVGAVPPGRPGSQARLLASIDTWGRSRGLVIDGSAGVIPRVSLHRAGSLAGRLSIPGMSGRGRVDLPALPPGRYRLEARARTAIPAPLTVRIGPAHLPAAVLDLSSPGPDGGGAALDLTFPVAVPNWAVSQPGGRVVPPVDLRIRPLTLLRPPVGMTAPARQVVAYGPWLAFFLDDGAYVEPDGFWVRPGHEVALVVGQPDASHGLRLSIRNVPLVNRVTVTSGKWHDELRLEPGAEREVVLPPPGPLRATVLRLRADRGGRPSQFDPGNHDQRELGAWIAFR
jgi:hypothetical protein